MKNFKNISFAGIFICLNLFTPACKKIDNFLDKAPGIDIDENKIFSSKAQVEQFIPAIYRYGIQPLVPYKESSLTPSGYGTVSSTYCYSENFTENGESEATFSNSVTWNNGLIQPNNIINSEDVRYFIRWIGIRYVNIMLERIAQVPDADQAYKDQIIGEVKAIRALNYLEMLKRYGGMPIVNKRFNNEDEVNVPRGSVEDCVNFIVSDCDDAFAKLPNAYPSNFVGRMTKGVALAIKAKALLFAASPLFNTATPYLSNGNDKLICYGNYDVARWQKAADAAKAALDWAQANGYKLITDKGNDKNYRYAWETPNNSEILLAEQIRGSTNYQNFPWAANWPQAFGSNFSDAVEVTHNFVKKYEKNDGTPMVWDAAGGTDLTAKYNQLDLRFKQTVAYNGSFWNANNPIVETFVGGKHANACKTGAWMKKFVPDALGISNVQPAFPLFRVNELYLNYAEALNEATSSGPPPEAYSAANAIRQRSGMPALPAGLNQAAFRVRIRNERDIELFAEDHHMWDLRRWLAADQDGVMRGPIQGLTITKVGTLYNWVPYSFETRTYDKKLNLHPLPLNEVQKGNLIQNPGW